MNKRMKRLVGQVLDWLGFLTLTIVVDGITFWLFWNWFVVMAAGDTVRIGLPVAIGLDGLISLCLDGVYKTPHGDESSRQIFIRHFKIDAFYLVLGFIVSRFI